MQYKEYNILAAKAAIMSRRRCNIMAVTANYETVMVVSLKNGEENVQKVVEKFKALIENNATLKNVDEWGKRRLAYEINDRTEGFYYLVNFKADSEFPKELERQYKITEGILRTIVIRKDEE